MACLRTLFMTLSISAIVSLGQVVHNNLALDVNLKYIPQNLTAVLDEKHQRLGDIADAIGPSFGKHIFNAIGGDVDATLNCTISADALSDTLFLYQLLQIPQYAIAALLYIDASAKIPNGIFQGHLNWVGEYQECLETIKPIFNTISQRNFKGKYFTASIVTNGIGFFPNPQTPKGTPIMMGLCLPDSYSKADTKCAVDMALNFLENLNQTASVLKPLNLSASTVYTDEDESFDSGAITALVISGIIVALVLVGTAIGLIFPNVDSDLTLLDGGKNLNGSASDTAHESTDYETADRSGLLDQDMFGDSIQIERWPFVRKKIIDVMRAFSFISNAKKLLNTPTAKSPLSCLNGMRVISMWWVIQGHVYGFALYTLDNPSEGYKIIQRFTFQPIVNGTFSVDTFFFLSGLLVAYLALKEVKDKGKLSWIYYFLHRFWRLTPLYAFVLMIFTTLWMYMFTGPYSAIAKSPDGRKGIDVCKDYWWTNLIYINNYYPDDGSLAGTCMGWAWYLAIDMQCYILLAPLFIFLLSHRKRHLRLAGIGYALWLVALCVGLRGFFIGYYGLKDSLQGKPTKHLGNEWIEKGATYQRTYTRMSVYMVGMLTGHICNATNCRIRMHKMFALLGWCVSIATALAVVYGMYYYNHNPGTQITLVASGFYNSLSRTLWSMCLSWVVIACMSGYGGPVNSILSWPIWAPLGRLTYGAYLVHPIVIYVYNLNLMTPLHFTDLTMIYLFTANLVVSYVIAFIVSMAVEAPMMQLEKLIVKRK